MKKPEYIIEETEEYREWLACQSQKSRFQIDGRLSRIEEYGHFGDRKELGHGLEELRWKGGRRIYYSIIEEDKDKVFLALLGGGKSKQAKDIKKAMKILEQKYGGYK